MGVAHVGLVHRDPCECKVKGFRAVSSIERNVSNRRHLQGVRHCPSFSPGRIAVISRTTLHVIKRVMPSSGSPPLEWFAWRIKSFLWISALSQ